MASARDDAARHCRLPNITSSTDVAAVRAFDTVEFVHIHKCGGISFEEEVPQMLCKGPCVHRMADLTRDVCCLSRPLDGLCDTLRKTLTKFHTRPRYISAFEEFGAYRMPWDNALKVAMVRQPYSRWVSEQIYKCRTAAGGNASVMYHMSDALAHAHPDHDHAIRNKIALGLLPPALVQELLHWRPIDRHPKEWEAARVRHTKQVDEAIAALGFVGVMEEYSLSLCLFAFRLQHLLVDGASWLCRRCCVVTSIVRPRNVATAASCPRAIEFTAEDQRLYAAWHNADEVTYASALRRFHAEVADATRRNWDGAPRACRCEFLAMGMTR